MLSTLLLATGALVPSGDHAALHPAGANLFFEAPDLTGARAAYTDIAAARFAADEEIGGFLSQLLGREQETLTLGSLVELGLATLGEDLALPGAEMLELTRGLAAFSVSLSGLDLDGAATELAASGEELSPELEERLGGVELRGVMDFESEDLAVRAAAIIRAEAGADEASGSGWVQRSGGEGWTTHSMLDAEPELALWLRQEGARLDFAFTLEHAPERPTEVAASLLEDPSFRTSAAALPASEGLVVYRSYSSLEDLDELPALVQWVPTLGEFVPTEVGPLVGRLFPAGHGLARTELVDGRFHIDEFGSLSSERSSPILGRGPITRESYRHVPFDAVSAWAMTLDREGVTELLLGSLADLGVEDPELMLAAFEDDHGFRPDRDLIGAIGGDAVLYTLPFTGVGLPKLFLSVELEDPERFNTALERLAELAVEQGEGLVTVSQRPYRKRPFYSFSPAQGPGDLLPTGSGPADMLGSFLSVQAAVGVLDDRALISYNGSWVKREMRRWLSRDGVEPYAPEILGEGPLPEGLFDHAVTDWGAIVGGLYDGLVGLLPLLGQGLGEPLPFAPEDLPSSERFLVHFEPTVSWSRAVEGGVLKHRESSLGPEMPWLLSAATVGAVASFFDVAAPDTPEPLLVEEPERSPSVESGTPLERAEADLGTIKLALVVCASDQGRYPADLASLKRPSKNFPEAYLSAGSSLTDPWGNDYRYTVDAEGREFQLWSLGPDGVDQGGEGDDLVAR